MEAEDRGLLVGDLPKLLDLGTHRAVPPGEMASRMAPVLGPAGITRIGDLTDLDHVGIPVVQAVRPWARALSVSQGKGFDLETARIGAIMEGLEKWRAETCQPDTAFLPRAELGDTPALDLVGLSKRADLSRDQLGATPLTWMQGARLTDSAPIMVPFDCVSLDFARPSDTLFLVKSSNGLGSGATFPEAVLSALLELIERDCMADFRALNPWDRAQYRLRDDALDSALPDGLHARLRAAQLDLALWDITNDLGVPAFHACLRDGTGGAKGHPLPDCIGAGCHLSSRYAVTRAITEALQSRATLISGVREDVSPPSSGSTRKGADLSLLFDQDRTTTYALRDFSGTTAGQDLLWVTGKLVEAGITQVAVVDLSLHDAGLYVARVVAPGMGLMLPHHHYVTGARHVARTQRP